MPIGIEIRNAETRRRRAEVHVAHEHLRIQDQGDADDDEQRLGREVGDREEDVEPGRLLDAADVEQRQHDAEACGDDHLARQPVAHEPAAGEHREVGRDGVGRDRDRDGVVEHLRPGREERDRLVEGAAGERRGAAGLGEARRRLGVGRRREREDHARDRERDRRHPPGVERRDAEGVVDRRADVAVGGREQVPHAEDGGQAMRAAAAEQRHALPGELPLAQHALRVEAHEHVHRLRRAAVRAVADDERAA